MSYPANSLLSIVADPESGKSDKFIVPDCRMVNAQATQDFVRRLIDNDTKRAFKRAKVDGLVGGNPPYDAVRLRNAGRADAVNVNWGNAGSYCEQGSGAFYDLTTEAPSFLTFITDYGSPEQRDVWSDMVARFANTIISKDRVWDYNMQLSQWDMVLHGCGPLMYEGPFDVLPRAVRCGALRVPEFTRSDTHYWDACEVDMDYYPPELYAFIKDEKVARQAGWNVEYTKRVIANAMSPNQQRGIEYSWEFYQQQLKNNALNYMYDDGKTNRLAYVYWKEFDGRISVGLVERSSTTGGPTFGESDAGKEYAKNTGETSTQYLYVHVGKYANWDECVHPQYFDRGNGGFHHSVTGLGVKMYSAMEYENRQLCRMADDAFSPKIMFSPTSEAAKQKFELAHLGPYGVLPAGFEMHQTPVAGIMQDSLAFFQLSRSVIQDRLSSYKGGAPTQKEGNPRTMYELMLQAQASGAINKTQFNRYYRQMDFLVTEIFRRLCIPGSTDQRAKDFQKMCKDAGIPREALDQCQYVGATRVVGQGSAMMRREAINAIMPIAGSLPEDGRTNLLNDKIASECGQTAVLRYNPVKPQSNVQSDQQAEALQWVACMKVGVMPVVTSTQNPVTYAATFLKSATDALQSLSQGANPTEVLKFMHIVGPAIGMQLQRMATDTTRTAVFKEITAQWKQLMAATDQLQQHVQQAAQQQQEQQAKTQTALTDQQLKQSATQSDIQIKTAKTQAQMTQSEQKHQQKLRHSEESAQLKQRQAVEQMQLDGQEHAQSLAIHDATAASDIHLSHAQTVAKIELDRKKAAEKPEPVGA